MNLKLAHSLVVVSNELSARLGVAENARVKTASAEQATSSAWKKTAEVAAAALVENRIRPVAEQEQLKTALADPDRLGRVFTELAQHNLQLRRELSEKTPVKRASLGQGVPDETVADSSTPTASKADDVISGIAARLRSEGIVG